MESFESRKHWDAIYQKENPNEVSWYQPTPSLTLLSGSVFRKTHDNNNDIGGCDSFFVDHLLDLGYQDITVLDIQLARRSGLEKSAAMSLP